MWPHGESEGDRETTFAARREKMVEYQMAARGIADERILSAVREVPRHAFVPENLQESAYDDMPLPIGFGQTISQPYTVAFMCEALRLSGGERVLEIGTGSGYAAAVLSRLCREVFTVERIPELSERAARCLAELGYTNVHVRTSNGTLGLPHEAPFDAIAVTAAAEALPQPYLDQLTMGGRIVIPLGSSLYSQALFRFTRLPDELRVEDLGGFAFVPLIGEYGWKDSSSA